MLRQSLTLLRLVAALLLLPHYPPSSYVENSSPAGSSDPYERLDLAMVRGLLGRRGGIGGCDGLKIRFPQGSVGSTPSAGRIQDVTPATASSTVV